jgi:hypothetical protein
LITVDEGEVEAVGLLGAGRVPGARAVVELGARGHLGDLGGGVRGSGEADDVGVGEDRPHRVHVRRGEGAEDHALALEARDGGEQAGLGGHGSIVP